MSNVLNKFDQPVNADKDDNIVTFAGTVNMTGTVAVTGTTTVTGSTVYDSTSFLPKKIANVLLAHDVEIFDSGTALNISGVNLVTGGTGIADFTLAAPEVGCLCTIRIDTISSGTVVVTTGSGITIGAGTVNTATFDAAEDVLVLAHTSATQWDVVTNIGSVALSTV